jgi:hypothetical protein
MANSKISPVRKQRLIIQGYNLTDEQLNDYKTGIRFAYALCATLVITGLVLNNITILIIAAMVAFGGAFPPYHPFDYLYNYGFRFLLNKPKTPPRTAQGRFACGIASVWLTVTIFLLYNDHLIAAYILGAILVTLAVMVTTTDICIPSMVYNYFFRKEKK